MVETGRLTKLMGYRGLDRVQVEEVEAGDIIAVAGLAEATVPDTVGSPEVSAAHWKPSRSIRLPWR